MKLIIDSREQDPLEFIGESEVGTLSTGDYSLKGFEDYIAIERKSLPDLLGSITSGRDRFERELSRSRGLEYFAIVVESDFSDISKGNFKSKMSVTSAVASILAFSVRYKLPIFFCQDRQQASQIVEGLLRQYLRQFDKKLKIVKDNIDKIKKEEKAKSHLF